MLLAPRSRACLAPRGTSGSSARAATPCHVSPSSILDPWFSRCFTTQPLTCDRLALPNDLAIADSLVSTVSLATTSETGSLVNPQSALVLLRHSSLRSDVCSLLRTSRFSLLDLNPRSHTKDRVRFHSVSSLQSFYFNLAPYINSLLHRYARSRRSFTEVPPKPRTLEGLGPFLVSFETSSSTASRVRVRVRTLETIHSLP